MNNNFIFFRPSYTVKNLFLPPNQIKHEENQKTNWCTILQQNLFMTIQLYSTNKVSIYSDCGVIISVPVRPG